MKTVALIMLTLFSFLHEERYEVSDYQCSNNQIKVEYEDTWYDVSLFNVFLKEDSDVCSYLTGDVSIEFDSYVKIENPLNVYVYANDVLLQQTLIDEQLASIKIDNPKYKYPLIKKEESVMKEVTQANEQKSVSTSKKIAIALIVIYVIVCILILCIKMRKNSGNIHDDFV
ncbi:MAG: hypothetical protein EOM50_02385 [Erysipelotrichia bacterium]|nr:hypothetical protein [Erysipelotrichia bacterium]NCC54803.1 hypothetical protein [Erysipelotrichia bacterium]